MTRQGCKFPAGLAAAIAMTVLPALPAGAADLGVRGATWPIAEPDLLVQIEARLSVMQHSGELARIEREARSRARSRLEEPDAVPGIAPARETRSRLFDPSIAVDRDIRLPDGALIAAAGHADEPAGARSAHPRPAVRRRPPRGGDRLGAEPREAREDRAARRTAARPDARTHARAFFFDQGGRLAARFGLRFTPSAGRAGRHETPHLPRYRSRTGTPPDRREPAPPAHGPGLSASRGGRPRTPNRRTERC